MSRRPIAHVLLAAMLVATALSGCGRAATTTVAPDESFSALDTNGDGRLTLAESRLTAAIFAEMDTNHDGALSQLEWQGAQIDPTLPGQIQERNEAQRPARPVGPGTW